MSPSTNKHSTLRLVLVAKAVAGIALTGAFFAGWWLRANGLTAGEFSNELSKGHEPRYEWRSVDKKHWQALGRAGDLTLTSTAPGASPDDARELDAREGNSAGCASGMVRVKGNFHTELHGEATGEIERLQDTACTDWISRDFPARCRTFDREKIASEIAKLPTRPLDFCMDRFEYPNVRGQNPIIVVTFHEAEAMCKKSKKRLCTENEWTFACEGEEARPYPQGWTRDSTACVVDRNWRPFAEGALNPRDGAGARAELDRLWQAEPSGSRGACKSAFGVYDMTGNVDEWTRSVRTTGFSSILKGGYWGPVRARCRPATRAHNEDFVAYQQGFRCCGESDASVPAPKPAPASMPEPPPTTPAIADPGKASPAASHGGPTADLSTEWEYGGKDDDKDEVVAIGRARVGPACDVAPRSIGASGDDHTIAFGGAGLLAIGLAVLRGSSDGRRGRGSAPGERAGEDGAPLGRSARRPREARRPRRS